MIIPPERERDNHGSGAYLASRGGRKHNGVDLACYKGSIVISLRAGIVTKIGYPYNPNDEKKGHLRYVQVTDSGGNHARYFYVKPSVSQGDTILAGSPIGVVQGLCSIYKGITDHYHFEVKEPGGGFTDPNTYISDAIAELLIAVNPGSDLG